MSPRLRYALLALALVLALSAGVYLFAPSLTSAQSPAASVVAAVPARIRNVIVGTFEDGSPVHGTGTAADKSPAAIAERSRLAALREGQS